MALRAPKLSRIAVDIDSTLYPSDPLFIKYLALRHGIRIRGVEVWDFWRDKISEPEFLDLIREGLHRPEEIVAAVPYAGAVEAINAWHAAGAEIHVVSDRHRRTVEPTTTWLGLIGLEYDRLVLRSPIDKVSYAIGAQVDLLIDDKPATLVKAVEAGITTATLIHPYNRAVLAQFPQIIAARTWSVLRMRLEHGPLRELVSPATEVA